MRKALNVTHGSVIGWGKNCGIKLFYLLCAKEIGLRLFDLKSLGYYRLEYPCTSFGIYYSVLSSSHYPSGLNIPTLPSARLAHLILIPLVTSLENFAATLHPSFLHHNIVNPQHAPPILPSVSSFLHPFSASVLVPLFSAWKRSKIHFM